MLRQMTDSRAWIWDPFFQGRNGCTNANENVAEMFVASLAIRIKAQANFNAWRVCIVYEWTVKYLAEKAIALTSAKYVGMEICKYRVG
jgi:hypothetical protein